MMAATILALLLAAALPVTVVRTVRREVPWTPGSAVKAAHRYGDLTISGSGQSRVVLNAVIRVTANDAPSASRLAEEIDVALLPGSDTVFVVTLFPESQGRRADLSFEVDIELTVPRAAEIITRNSFGNSSLSGLTSDARVHNRFGDVSIDRCRDCEVVNRHGNVQVRRTTGRLAVENHFGDVSLDSITARTTVDNRYGDVTVWIQNPTLTDLDVDSELGRVQLRFDRFVPFRLEGATMRGDIRSSLPLELETEGYRRFVSGALGEDGPFIRLTGTRADFLIQTDNETTGTRERR